MLVATVSIHGKFIVSVVQDSVLDSNIITDGGFINIIGSSNVGIVGTSPIMGNVMAS